MWRVVVALIVLFLVVSILGAVLSALRWLLGVGVLIALVAALFGAAARSKKS
ncbi:MAG: hypothetical protein ACRDU4_02525 [Mycobacterium sp.]